MLRKTENEAGAESQSNFRNIITKNADGMIISRDGVIRFLNPAAEAIFGRTPGESIGEDFGFPIMMGESTEVDIIHMDGQTATAEMRVVEIEWEGKAAFLASFKDMTERK